MSNVKLFVLLKYVDEVREGLSTSFMFVLPRLKGKGRDLNQRFLVWGDILETYSNVKEYLCLQIKITVAHRS